MLCKRNGKEMVTYNGEMKVNDTFYVSSINKDFLFVEVVISKKCTNIWITKMFVEGKKDKFNGL
jgi:hypothetical protein